MVGIFFQSVVRLRPRTRVTRGGDVVSDWRSVTRETISNLSVQPNTQREDITVTGDLSTVTMRVLTMPGHVPDVDFEDRIEFAGRIFALVGKPAVWSDPHGGDHLEWLMTTYQGG